MNTWIAPPPNQTDQMESSEAQPQSMTFNQIPFETQNLSPIPLAVQTVLEAPITIVASTPIQQTVVEASEDQNLNNTTQAQAIPALNSLYKTQLCKHFLTSKHCHVGNKCHFAHGDNELRKKDDPLPVDVQMKMLNIPYNNFKTQKCKYFFDPETPGICKFGKNCSYAHGTEDIRNPYNNIDLGQLVQEHYGIEGYNPDASPISGPIPAKAQQTPTPAPKEKKGKGGGSQNESKKGNNSANSGQKSKAQPTLPAQPKQYILTTGAPVSQQPGLQAGAYPPGLVPQQVLIQAPVMQQMGPGGPQIQYIQAPHPHQIIQSFLPNIPNQGAPQASYIITYQIMPQAPVQPQPQTQPMTAYNHGYGSPPPQQMFQMQNSQGQMFQTRPPYPPQNPMNSYGQTIPDFGYPKHSPFQEPFHQQSWQSNSNPQSFSSGPKAGAGFNYMLINPDQYRNEESNFESSIKQ